MTETTKGPRGSRARPRKAFWLTLVAAFLIIGSWSVANPIMAAPDEPAHAVKAAATVRGQLFADESSYNPGRGDFEVPELFRQLWTVPCFGFQPETTPTCFGGFSGDLSAPSESTSHVARYNPLYYAIVGLPSLLPLSPSTVIYMRLVGAALNALLIAYGVKTLVEISRPTWPILGFAAALTPMVIYHASSLTPQGVELTGAASTWVILLALSRSDDAGLRRSWLWRLALVSSFFVLSRGVSPLYLAIVVGVVIFAAPRIRQVIEIVRERKSWPQLIVCVGVGVIALAYTLISGSLALGVVYPDPTLTPSGLVRVMVGNTGAYLEQLIGVFGWGETHLPLWVLLLSGGVVIVVSIVGWSLATVRQKIAIFSLVAIAGALPILMQLQSLEESGLVWQGKYVLPLAMGLPIVAGFLASQAPMTEEVGSRVAPQGVILIALVQVVAFATNLKRYVSGAHGEWFNLTEVSWQPVLNPYLFVVLYVLLWGALVVAAHRVLSTPRDADSAESMAIREPKMTRESATP